MLNKRILISGIVGATIAIILRVITIITWRESFSSLVLMLIITFVPLLLFYLLLAATLTAPLVDFLARKGFTNLLIYLPCGVLVGLALSLLMGILLKSIAEKPCDSVCLDPGTYFPFVKSICLEVVAQILILWEIKFRR